MSSSYIYTEKNDCQDCYKCIRKCPVKAIKIEKQSASILQENCVYCGYCTISCPMGAKKVREDISSVKYLLQKNEDVIVSLAPTWVSEFPDFNKHEIISLLKKLGFSKISETALGAEIISTHIKNTLLNDKPGVHISPCCPSSVELIQKYYSSYSKHIIKVDTPMLAHGKFLREHYGNNVKVVFIGPCISKKGEADNNPGVIDVVITFNRLKEWLKDEGLLEEHPESDNKHKFEPFESNKGSLYPITGGMIAALRDKNKSAEVNYMSFSGINTIIPILNDLEKLENHAPVFLELMSCVEGCICGPGTSTEDAAALKRTLILKNYKSLNNNSSVPKLEQSLLNNYGNSQEILVSPHTESEIDEILKSIGKRLKTDELNCGGCGYEDCREFAKAILSDKAERSMCVSYMKRVAQDKASLLLQRIPYGVVIVDEELKVQESNKIFADFAGQEAVLAFEAKPGLEGADLTKLIPYYQYFSNLFHSRENVLEQDIHSGPHHLHLSIFKLDNQNLLCGIIHNLRAPEITREEIIKRTRKVIRENLSTVQKIAFYLGENASNMETLLNSIVDIQQEDYEERSVY